MEGAFTRTWRFAALSRCRVTSRCSSTNPSVASTARSWARTIRASPETRMKDSKTGTMGRVANQGIVAAKFRHDTSRNLDPQLHTHAVLANMVRGGDGRWRSMANEGLYDRQKLIGMLYRNELAAGLAEIEAFSTRRAEIEAAMEARGLGETGASPRLAERAALMTRAGKRDIGREELQGVWARQAAGAEPASPAAEAVAWATAHLSEREAVFSRSDLLAAALAHAPGRVSIEEVERRVAALERDGALHAVDMPGARDSLATDRTVGEERETVALMRAGQARGRATMWGWMVQAHLSRGPLTDGQKDAVKLIL